jgi:hypothetical protein
VRKEGGRNLSRTLLQLLLLATAGSHLSEELCSPVGADQPVYDVESYSTSWGSSLAHEQGLAKAARDDDAAREHC